MFKYVAIIAFFCPTVLLASLCPHDLEESLAYLNSNQELVEITKANYDQIDDLDFGMACLGDEVFEKLFNVGLS